MKLARRALMAGGLASLGARASAADMQGFPHDPHGPPPAVRVAQSAAGTAGAVWKPLIESMPESMRAGLGLQWMPGAPGLSQFELVTNRVDVARFGAMGTLQARARGADLVIFGPALFSHGRWLVPAASPFRHPQDLVGRRVACPLDISETFQQANLAAATVGLDIRRELVPVFGTLEANQAAFERQDVEAIIALEPMATQLVTAGAREIATVAQMWCEGTGDTQPLFLLGMAAYRRWVVADPGRAKRVAQLVMDANSVVRANPARLGRLQQMATIYAADWDEAVFASMDRQVEAALRVGLIKAAPPVKVYVTS